ncbi:MAG: heme-binding domain-containing protein [Bacteroidia bacterium]
MKRLSLLLSAVLVSFLLWQISGPDLSNPSFDPADDLLSLHPAPQQTADLLRAACYDCHSNQTHWPWYAHLNPIGGFVSGHVRHGREEINFSEWNIISDEDISVVGKGCAKRIKSHSMPIESYMWLHPKARLNEAERLQLISYFLNLNPRDHED